MSGRKKIYEALIDGARQGLTGEALYAHVAAAEAKASSKKIVRASLLALSDPDVKDAAVLEAIYALAIKHRLDPVTAHDHDDEVAVEPVEPKSKKKDRK
jgi:hypothetical protein